MYITYYYIYHMYVTCVYNMLLHISHVCNVYVTCVGPAAGLRLHQPHPVGGQPVVRVQGDGRRRPLHAGSASSGEARRAGGFRPAGGVRTRPVRRQPGRLPAWVQPAGVPPGEGGGGGDFCNYINSTNQTNMLYYMLYHIYNILV